MKIPEGWPTGNMLLAFEEEAEVKLSMESFDNGLRAAFEAAPTPPAQDEPIYQVSLSGINWTDATKEGFDSWGSENKRRALYTRPDGLRKAAEEALLALEEQGFLNGRTIRIIENLRAALEGK